MALSDRWEPDNHMGLLKKQSQKGFTFIELIVVIGIMTTLLGIATTNLLGAQNSASLNTTVDTLISDIRNQQLKALTTDTQGRATTDNYGVYFETDNYVLFHGSIYSPADPSNYKIDYGNQIQASNISFPNSEIIFSKGNGEISGYTSGSNTITLLNTSTNQQKTIQFNQLGVITGIY